MVPNKSAMMTVNIILTAVYDGFLQYDNFCFHRQARH